MVMNLMILKYLKRKHQNLKYLLMMIVMKQKKKKLSKKLELRKAIIMKFDERVKHINL